MFENDLLCRCIMYPRGFTDDELELATFMKADEIGTTGTYAVSVGSRFSLRDERGAHQYGNTTAAIANEAKSRRKNAPLEPDQVAHYVGFYDISCGDIWTTYTEYYVLDIRWRPEHGNREHFQIEFNPVAGRVSTRQQKRDDRSAAQLIMAERLRGPHRNPGPYDPSVEQILQRIELPKLPRQ